MNRKNQELSGTTADIIPRWRDIMNTVCRTRRPIAYYMRWLHRDIGYVVLGLTIVYALSGVILVYRETDFLKSPKDVSMQLSPQMSIQDLSRRLHLRRPEITKKEGDVISFHDGENLKNGVYNTATGSIQFTAKQLPGLIERFISLHKLSSSKPACWISVIYGILLLFLALSSLWMFTPSTRKFRRGIMLTTIGVTLAVVLVFVV